MKEKSHFYELFWDLHWLLLDFYKGKRFSTKEIAQRMGRSERTVRRYLEIIKKRVRLEKDENGKYYLAERGRSVPCDILLREEWIEALKMMKVELEGTEYAEILEEMLEEIGEEVEGSVMMFSLDGVDMDVLFTLSMSCRDMVPVRIILSNNEEIVFHVHCIVRDENEGKMMVEGYERKGNGSSYLYLPLSHIVYAEYLEKGREI